MTPIIDKSILDDILVTDACLIGADWFSGKYVIAVSLSIYMLKVSIYMCWSYLQ